MNAEIIAVGSELLTPYRLDTNSLVLTAELNQLGIRVMRKTVVGDNRQELREALDHALSHADVVVCSGGLGPTEDDLTRETVAELLGRKLQRNEEILRGIQERFRKFGRAMPETNVRQAMVPEGADVLDNPRGTAPGLWLETNGRYIVLLPGPPNELKAMFENEVRQRLARHAPKRRLYTRDLRVDRNVRIGRRPSGGQYLQEICGGGTHDSGRAGRNSDSSAGVVAMTLRRRSEFSMIW